MPNNAAKTDWKVIEIVRENLEVYQVIPTWLPKCQREISSDHNLWYQVLNDDEIVETVQDRDVYTYFWS